MFQPEFCPEIMKHPISRNVTNILNDERFIFAANCLLNHRDHLRLVAFPLVKDAIRSVCFGDQYVFSDNPEYHDYIFNSIHEKDEILALEWVLDQVRP